jgi:hypothetical protein
MSAKMLARKILHFKGGCALSPSRLREGLGEGESRRRAEHNSFQDLSGPDPNVDVA